MKKRTIEIVVVFRFSALILFFFAIAQGSLSAGEDDFRLDAKGLYKKPSEVFSPEDIAVIHNKEIRAGEGVEERISQLESILGKYSSQFLGEKRIWEDRSQGSRYFKDMDANTARLILSELTEKNSESYLIRSSPYLYQLHCRLAELYHKKGNRSAEIRSYLAAFRYRKLSQTEEDYTDPERLLEEVDETAKQKAEAHSNAMREKAKSKASEEAYQQSLRENYIPYKNRKAREDATNLFRLATAVREAEDKNKERLKVVNKQGSAGKGIFVLFDYKRNNDFSAYEILLERAYRVDPFFPDTLLEVAHESKISGRKDRAIEYYRKYIELKTNPPVLVGLEDEGPKSSPITATETPSEMETAVEEETEPEEESVNANAGGSGSSRNPKNISLASAYLNLAILYADRKQKVLAGFAYEEYLNLETDEEKRDKMYFELGNFFQNQVGNLEKATQYYQNWLKKNSRDNGLEPESEKKEMIFRAMEGISWNYKRLNFPKEEETAILSAILRYDEIKAELSSKEEEITSLEKALMDLKKNLLTSTQDDALSQFRVTELRMEDVKAERNRIQTRLKSLPIGRVFLRLAELRENRKDLKGAIEVLDQVIEVGNEVEMNLALRTRRKLEERLARVNG